MKKKNVLVTFMCLMFVLKVSSQAPPEQINYQGSVRNPSGAAVTNQNVGLRFEIIETTGTGTLVTFTEIQTVQTNSLGLFTTQIGKNSALSSVNWMNSPVFLRLGVDVTGGTSYTDLALQQMVSVPYALYAKSAGNAVTYTAGTNVMILGTGSTRTISSTPSLSIGGNALSISNGNTVLLPDYAAGPNIAITTPTSGSTYTISAVTPVYVGGNNISVTTPTSGNTYTINSTAPVYTGGDNISVSTPTSGNTYTINSTAPIYAAGNNISVSTPTSGNTYTINSTAPQYVAGNNVTIVAPGSGNTYTINAVTPTVAPLGITLNSPHTAVLSGNSATLNIVPPSITGTGLANVSTSGNSYTVSVPLPAMSVTGNTLNFTQGTVNINQALPAQGWQLGGNNGTSPATNYIGTGDAQDLRLSTNAIERMRIFQTGGVSIGGATPANLGSALSLQGTPAATWGQLAVRSNGTGAANQSYMSFAGGAGPTRYGFVGDFATTDQDMYVHGENNLRLGAGINYTNSAMFINGTNDFVGIGSLAPSNKLTVINNSANSTIFGNNNATFGSANANGIEGITSNTDPGASGVRGQNTGNGAGISGINTSSATSLFAHGVYGLTNSSGAQASGVYGANLSVGAGVYGKSTYTFSSGDAHGVRGESSNSAVNSYGVYGMHFGTGSGVYGQTSSSAANASGVIGYNTGMGAGLTGISANSGTASTSSHGVVGQTGNPSPNAVGVIGYNTGTGAGVYGSNSSANPPSISAVGVRGETSNTHAQAAGVIGQNYGMGSGVHGVNSNGASATGAHGIHGETYNPNTLAAGVYARNWGQGYGVFGLTQSSGANVAAIYGENMGAGPSLFGLKTGGSVGTAGRFEITNAGNPSDAVFAITNGGGAALHVANGPALSNNLCLLIDNGHIKSIGSPAISSTVAIIGTLGALTTTCNSCTDVKGNLAISFGTATSAPGDYIVVQVQFAKPYPNVPAVTLTPHSDMGGMSYYISSVSNGFFNLKIVNNNSFIVSSPTSYKFNYMVIE